MAGHYALRGEQPTEQDIQQVLVEDTLQVVASVFGHSPDFARANYLLMKQETQGVKIASVLMHEHERWGTFKGLLSIGQKLSAYSPMEGLNPRHRPLC